MAGRPFAQRASGQSRGMPSGGRESQTVSQERHLHKLHTRTKQSDSLASPSPTRSNPKGQAEPEGPATLRGDAPAAYRPGRRGPARPGLRPRQGLLHGPGSAADELGQLELAALPVIAATGAATGAGGGGPSQSSADRFARGVITMSGVKY